VKTAWPQSTQPCGRGPLRGWVTGGSRTWRPGRATGGCRTCSGRERLTKRAYGQMGRWPGELELFVAVEHRSDAHQLKTDDRVVVAVFDGVPGGGTVLGLPDGGGVCG